MATGDGVPPLLPSRCVAVRYRVGDAHGFRCHAETGSARVKGISKADLTLRNSAKFRHTLPKMDDISSI